MMEAAERELLVTTVKDALAAVVGIEPADAADAALIDLGWHEMLEAERADAVAIVFQALGAANLASSALDDVIISSLGLAPSADVAALLPAFTTWDPPGTRDGDVSAHGLTTGRVTSCAGVLVVGRDGSECWTATVPIVAAHVHAISGVDPDAGLHRIELEHAPAEVRALDRTAWESAVAWSRVAVAHQLAGACRSMLELARTHALERVQFGRPIARFQAVRHRLAEALVAVEALEASLTAAIDTPGPMTAALAKAAAGRATRTVSAHVQQILAGIGFTTDHPFHCYLKRAMTLDGLFGSAEAITRDVGRHLLATRRVPTLIEL